MHSSIKYLMAIATTVTLTQSQAELVQSSSLNNDNDRSRVATRVLNREAQSFNSNFTNLNSLSITERSGDKVRRETIAAKIEIPEDEPSVIEKTEHCCFQHSS
jgi:rare lipoprotein A